VTRSNVLRLEDHLEDCEERYNSVINRLTTMDARLDHIEQGLKTILDLLNNSRDKTLQRVS
jgi:archaellum component FlaC